MSGSPDLLLDVTRLVWRAWRGGKPTGVDRVCLAYLDHYRDRARAVVQRKGLQLVLSRRQSARLFALLGKGAVPRRHLVAALALMDPGLLRPRLAPGTLYFNVGHTGLNEPTLSRWIRRKRLRAVHLVHDLIPITHPEYCRSGEERRHRERMDQVLASAAGIIGNSQATLDELAAYAAAQRQPLPPTIAAWISGLLREADGPAIHFDRPHFLAVGTIEGRKNHQVLLDAWTQLERQLGERTPLLLIVGRRGWQADDVFARLDDLGPLAPYVREFPNCGDEELTRLMRGAHAMLMPSLVEGFGLPVIEAMQLGIPVIASRLAVYRELVGDLPTYVDPLDTDAWVRAVTTMATDQAERQRQMAKLTGYRAPTWAEHFALVDPWAEQLPERFGPALNP